MVIKAARRMMGYTGTGLMLQELLYGFIMALLFITAAQFRLIGFGVKELIILIVGMNFTWGLIDMLVFFTIDTFDQKKYIRIIEAKKKGMIDEAKIRMLIKDELSGTIADIIDAESEKKVVDLIMDSDLEPEDQILSERRNMFYSAFFCFLLTMFTVIPVILPLLLVSDFRTALFYSAGFASIMLFFVGYYVAPYFGQNRWLVGIGILAFTGVITLLATFTGG
ncbi:MAG: VIT1/CCC1 transporter family protein [Candidatus Methanomethylophilaceae archaeon]